MENPKQTSPNPSFKGGESKPNKWGLVSLSLELGFIIALPLLAFAFAGKWLDQRLHTNTPWFTLLGIILAIAATTVWLTKKLKQYVK